jgi:hypothetical protein
MGRTIVLALGLVVIGAPALAQVVKNPNRATFTCPDHAADDQHELDIIRESDNFVISTLLLGDPVETAGEVTTTINVQPIAFGRYYAVVRAVAGPLKSESSAPSNVFERGPLRPGTVRFARAVIRTLTIGKVFADRRTLR